jgi:hypothetical protein
VGVVLGGGLEEGVVQGFGFGMFLGKWRCQVM